MLPLRHRIAFAIFAVVALILAARGFMRLYQRIIRGRRDSEERTDRPAGRFWYALKTTLLQQRVFRRRYVLGVFHSFIFYAFVLYLVVNGIDALGGYVSFRPSVSPTLLGAYGALTDAFSVLAVVGVLMFVLRRFFLPSRRDFWFNERTLLQKKVQRGYIQRDSIIVSVFILFHVGSRIAGNAARLAMSGAEASQPFSSAIAPVFAGPHAFAWRILGYWGALGSILLFLAYFPYTKHIHLLCAPLKYFFARRASSGTMPPVQLDFEAAEPEVGAAFLADFAQPRLLDAYACIQCNRCQDVCPASQTGKALSPAALEINKRMALNALTEEVSAFSLTGTTSFEQGRSRGPALLQAIISSEAVWACTTCGACMEVCPTQDEQMLDILDIRRNLVMQQGEFPSQLQSAFRGMERSSNPWGIARDKRTAWMEGLDVPLLEDVPEPDVLYWVGCAASYDGQAQKTARAVVQLLAEAKVRFAVLGKRECCSGDSARRAGNELLYQQLANEAVATLQEARPRLVLASCPHCVNTIANEYPQLGGNFIVRHHTEYLAELVDRGQLKPLAGESSITFHDPCYLGRHRGSYEQPRSLLKILGNDYVDLPRTRENAFCCGAGGAQFWKEEEPGNERVSENRFREAQNTLANTTADKKVLAVGCPFCKSMLQSTPAAASDESIVIKDVAELLWEGVQRSKANLIAEPADTATSLTSPSQVQAAVGILDAETTATPKDASPRTSAMSTGALPDAPYPQGNQPAPEPSMQAVPPAGNATPRKKWVPKTASSSSPAPSTDQPASPAHPQLPIANEIQQETVSLPPRKKWAPKIEGK